MHSHTYKFLMMLANLVCSLVWTLKLTGGSIFWVSLSLCAEKVRFWAWDACLFHWNTAHVNTYKCAVLLDWWSCGDKRQGMFGRYFVKPCFFVLLVKCMPFLVLFFLSHYILLSFFLLALDIQEDLVQACLHFRSVQIGIQFAFCACGLLSTWKAKDMAQRFRHFK